MSTTFACFHFTDFLADEAEEGNADMLDADYC